MGRRGPPPTPTSVLKARGSWRGKARSKEPRPAVMQRAPKPPKELNEVAAICWRETAPKLVAMGVLADTDFRALSRYCTMWARWIKASEFLEKFGEYRVLKDSDGNATGAIEEWPQVKTSLAYDQALRRMEQEFGLTPSARTRVPAMPPRTQLDLEKERFLFGPPDQAPYYSG